MPAAPSVMTPQITAARRNGVNFFDSRGMGFNRYGNGMSVCKSVEFYLFDNNRSILAMRSSKVFKHLPVINATTPTNIKIASIMGSR